MADGAKTGPGPTDEPADPHVADDPGSAPEDGDFAEEHKDVTLADEMPGGPEGRRDSDSPRGLAGAD